jgi:PhzF family phenazine biosynthesis protein
MDLTKVEHIAAFCDGDRGGNPAGVMICDILPEPARMQAIAAKVGYSETAFAALQGDGSWRVRYFAPEIEIPFCGHATIALGALLAARHGSETRTLVLNATAITVDGVADAQGMRATFTSPPVHSRRVDPQLVERALDLFSYGADELDPRIPPAMANAGNDHLVLALRSRELLSAMAYQIDAGRTFMLGVGVATVTFVFAESAQRIHVRNPFASGGVYEDPATGSAAAALGGYLGDLAWPSDDQIEILQGDDMDLPCRLFVEIPQHNEDGVRVSGLARFLGDERDEQPDPRVGLGVA